MSTLREKKAKLKTTIQSAHLEGSAFRKINDPGECATLLTIQLEDQKTAEEVAHAPGSKTSHQALDGTCMITWSKFWLTVMKMGYLLYHKNMLPKNG